MRLPIPVSRRVLARVLTSPERLVRAADLSATFVSAVSGALVAAAEHLDPVGMVALAFLSALGGGLARDFFLGARPAAMQDRIYPAIVLAAATATWVFAAPIGAATPGVMIVLNAGGLALAAVAGTEKALDNGSDPLNAIFIGAVNGVGGSTLRELVLNQVPSVFTTAFVATPAMAAALTLIFARRLGLPPRAGAVAAGLLCFGLRMAAVRFGWHWPRWWR